MDRNKLEIGQGVIFIDSHRKEHVALLASPRGDHRRLNHLVLVGADEGPMTGATIVTA